MAERSTPREHSVTEAEWFSSSDTLCPHCGEEITLDIISTQRVRRQPGTLPTALPPFIRFPLRDWEVLPPRALSEPIMRSWSEETLPVPVRQPAPPSSEEAQEAPLQEAPKEATTAQPTPASRQEPGARPAQQEAATAQHTPASSQETGAGSWLNELDDIPDLDTTTNLACMAGAAVVLALHIARQVTV